MLKNFKKVKTSRKENKRMMDEKKEEILDLAEEEKKLIQHLSDFGKKFFDEAKNALPNYFFIDLLGSGSYGVVWRVADSNFNSYVIKQMSNALFNSEIRILKMLRKHCKKYYPCILDYIETVNYTYVIMEDTPDYISLDKWSDIESKDIYRDNKTDVINAARYESKVSYIACKLFDVINHLHNEDKIIHNDIKPQNILINPSTYDIKLIDFGLACDICEGKFLSGSEWFRAPEMALTNENSKFNDYRLADLYALGVTLFDLLYIIPYHNYFRSVIYGIKVPPPSSFVPFMEKHKKNPAFAIDKVRKLSLIYKELNPTLISNILQLLSAPTTRDIKLKC